MPLGGSTRRVSPTDRLSQIQFDAYPSGVRLTAIVRVCSSEPGLLHSE